MANQFFGFKVETVQPQRCTQTDGNFLTTHVRKSVSAHLTIHERSIHDFEKKKERKF